MEVVVLVMPSATELQEGRGPGMRVKTKPLYGSLAQVPGACMWIAGVFKEVVLSGSRQPSQACQVQNLITYSQLSLLFNLVNMYHF